MSAGDALRRAAALDASGRSEEAAALYRELLTQNPGDPDVLNALALIEKRRGNATEAESLLRKAIAAAPRSHELHNNLANLLHAAGQRRPVHMHVERRHEDAEPHPHARGELVEAADFDDPAIGRREDESFAPRRLAFGITEKGGDGECQKRENDRRPRPAHKRRREREQRGNRDDGITFFGNAHSSQPSAFSFQVSKMADC